MNTILPSLTKDTRLPSLTKDTRLDDPYVVAGDRAYLVGAQAGGFPPMGHHIRGQMGGLWAHPHKLLDGFWCAIQPADDLEARDQNPDGEWLISAMRFESYPWGVRQWFDLPSQGIRVCRTLLIPDGRPALLVDWTLYDTVGRQHALDLFLVVRSNLRAGWSSFADPDPVAPDRASPDPESGDIWATDRGATWSVIWGSLERPIAAHVGAADAGPEPAMPRSPVGVQRFRISVDADGESSLRLGILDVSAEPGNAPAALRDLLHQAPDLIAEKAGRLSTMLSRAHLETPDERLDNAWTWTHCAYDWLIRDVPGTGRGLGAGIPDYPWWFSCDSAYALRGLLPLGEFALAEQTLRILATASVRSNPGNGRIIHELTCTDQVINPGNTQETPQFACAVLETYLWSGDRRLIEDLYPLCRQGVLSWTLGACDTDRDLLPEGYGITEVAGLNIELIDSSVWAHQGVCAIGRMASLLGDQVTAAQCADLAPRIRAAIEGRFWLAEEGLYGDLVATPGQVIPRIEHMLSTDGQKPGRATPAMMAHLEMVLQRARALPTDEEVPWFFGNWVVNAPLEAGLSPRERATAVLDRLETPRFLGPDGVYLNCIDQGYAMSITTGALAAAEVAYGRIDRALRLCRLLADQLELRTPGAISEMSPDGGCFVQAWSGYGAVYPLACGVFGLFPDAASRHLVLTPSLPDSWPYARLHDVRIGDAVLSLALERDKGQVICHAQVDRPGWHVSVLPPESNHVTFVARTALSIHAAASEGRCGLAPAVARSDQRIMLPARQTTSFQVPTQ